MRLIFCVIAFSILGSGLYAGVMPEEAKTLPFEKIITFEDQKLDYSSDTVEPSLNFEEKFKDFIHFTFMSIFLII